MEIIGQKSREFDLGWEFFDSTNRYCGRADGGTEHEIDKKKRKGEQKCEN